MNDLLTQLYKAILAYEYPKKAIDLETRREWEALDYIRLENCIRAQLMDRRKPFVRAGLANIVYWGNYNQGTRDTRLAKFLRDVSDEHLSLFIDVVHAKEYSPTLVAECGIPWFSRLSFVSKLLMFLDPVRFVTLDLQLAKLGDLPGPHVLSSLFADETSIRLTDENLRAYDRWCKHCKDWAAAFPAERGVRAADVERGIFGIIQSIGPQQALQFLVPPGL